MLVSGLLMVLMAAAVSAEELLSIVDIGVGERAEQSLAVSPDGAFAAVEIRQADLARNVIDVRWIVLPLDGRGGVTEVGDGGAPLQRRPRGPGSARFTPQVPQWSPDSQWIAYRVQRNGEVQLWRSRRDGQLQEQLTSNAADVAEFRWSAEGERLFFEVYEDRAALEARLRAEARRGYLYDERYSAYYSRSPLPADAEPTASRLWVYDLRQHVERPATADEQQEYRTLRLSPRPTAAAEDRRALRDTGVDPPLTLVWTPPSGGAAARTCTRAECQGHFRGVWVSDDGRRVTFLRFVDPNEVGAMALFVWTPLDDHLRRLMTTEGFLKGCSPARGELICAYETATHPARLIAIDLDSGEHRVLYDPNPLFAQREFGAVSELRWTDEAGVQGFGHLVKPIGYEPGRRYPLIIVQYRSLGFLRGGVGDEYPIPLFAANGFVVLSFHRPEDRLLEALSRSYDELEARGWIGERDRRRVLRSLEAGLDALDQQGLIDPACVGITGLSDGGETAAFALIHLPKRFAAAAVSWTAYSPMLLPLMGPRFQPQFERWGFLLPEQDLAGRWDQVAIARNAASLQAPLLIQVADLELLPETHTVAALKAHRKPVELHVFPDEDHIKWQPAHRYAIYRRNLQWFQFWLQHWEGPDPVDEGQYARWRSLRSLQEAR